MHWGDRKGFYGCGYLSMLFGILDGHDTESAGKEVKWGAGRGREAE